MRPLTIPTLQPRSARLGCFAALTAGGLLSGSLSAQVLLPIQTFDSPQPVYQAGFGSEVLVDSGLLVVGAGGSYGTSGAAQGLVYFYDELTGQRLSELAPEDPQAYGFGNTLAVDPPLLVIGATDSRPNDLFSAGAVYVYDMEKQEFRGTLLRSEPRTGDFFGTALAIEGGRIVAGSSSIDDVLPNSGAVYVYDAETLEFIRELDPGPRLSSSGFGRAVGLRHGLVYVGYARYSSGTGVGIGAVFVFDLETGVVLDRILPPYQIEAPNGGSACFGCSLGLDEDLLVIGAPDSGTGAVFLYDMHDGEFLAELRPRGMRVSRFGSAITLSEAYIVVSATSDSTFADRAGSVFVYRRDTFELIARLSSFPPQAGETTGGITAVSGDIVYVPSSAFDLDDTLRNVGRVNQFSVDCPADFDSDGGIDSADFELFIIRFLEQSLRADFNDDGFLDLGDVQQFLLAYSDGC